MKTRILQKLREAGDYVSGQALSEELGVSRTAVWKAIRQLESEGFLFDAVRNRGYRLVIGKEMYSGPAIQSVLKTKWLGHLTQFAEELDSTNNQIKRLAEMGAEHGTLVVAGFQSAGKGRRGRTWVSPEGNGIWMSFLLRPQFSPEYASMLTLVAALAVAAGIEEMTGLKLENSGEGEELPSGIKWPNDIVVRGKKICGILTEMSCDMDSIQYVVIGIGINVGKQEFPEEIRETASSLELCTGLEIDRALLIDAVLRHYETYYETFEKTLDLSGLLTEYNRRLVNLGRSVRVLQPNNEYTGVSKGITETGELLVELPDGSVREILSGEVSVRGVYGYV